MILEIDTKLLDLPVKININQLVFLSMVLDKNQKTYNQDVRNLVSLISDEDISYLINQKLITSIERSDKIIYEPSEQLKEMLIPNKSNFDLFYDQYPIYVMRNDGGKDYLRTNVNKCRKLYNAIVGNSTAMAEHINKCLKFEIDKKMRRGELCYMKTMWRWLQDHQWEASEEEMRDSTQNISTYGTEII